jgi:uncharacterized protein (TIGR02996 family)
MATEDDGFLRAIAAAPRDPLPRQVYADWLEEQGDVRGEYLRVQCLLATRAVRGERRRELRRRERQLQAEIDPRWLTALPRLTPPSRGTLLQIAWDVARRYRNYGAYGNDRKACDALERRCRGFSADQYRAALRKALWLCVEAEDIVARNLGTLTAQTVLDGLTFPDFRPFADDVRARAPGFQMSTYMYALGWAYYATILR